MRSGAITVTDMFCGCGGSSTGAAAINGVEVKLAMNHWRLAVDSHNTNHPNTDHDCADIQQTDPRRYCRTSILIASPECTNHSLAKGQKRKNLHQQDLFQQKAIDPKVIRSRATMWDVVRFAEVHDYEYVVTENVDDVRKWALFEMWLKAMHTLGYQHECVYLNAMFAHGDGIHGYAPQSRDRIYIVFWKRGNPRPNLDIRPKAPCPKCVKVVSAIQTWKPGRRAGKYDPNGKLNQYYYRCPTCHIRVEPFYYAAINAIDLTLPAVKIGERHLHKMPPLAERTMERIRFGYKKYGLRPFYINSRYGSGVECRISDPAAEPLDAQVARMGDYVVQPYLIDMAFLHSGADRARGVDEPMPTATTKLASGVLMPFTVSLNAYDVRDNVRSTVEALPTQTTSGKEGLIIPGGCIPVLHGTSTAKGFTDPMPAQTTVPHHGLVLGPSALLTMRGGRSLSDLSGPMPTQVAAGVQNWMVQQHPLLTPYYGSTESGASAFEPMGTATTKDRQALTFGPGEVDLPIEDLYFRMLTTQETKLAQGFPLDYVILGNKEDQQKQIGNANPPPTMQLLVQRCVEALEGKGAARG